MSFHEKFGAARYLALVQAVIGFEWLRAGWEKIADSRYVDGMSTTLSAFASKNPTGFYRDFLTGTARPNATFFAYAVSYGELLVGLATLVTAVVVLTRASMHVSQYVAGTALTALAIGAFMNLNFWIAAGWMSSSTDSINVVMLLTQAILGAAALGSLRAVHRVTVHHSTRVSHAVA